MSRKRTIDYEKLAIYCNTAGNIYIVAVRLVLDKTAMVAAIRSDAGASRRLLVAALEQRFTLLLSVALMVEYEAMLTRTQHLAASKLSVADVGILLDAVASVGEPVRPAFLWRPSLRDADDDMVLEVAVNGNADAIVTFNRRDFRPATERFGIEVLLPFAAIERLGGIL
jgi:putative PIN family toxin of toxin-antitoxin system